jgi:hypothetical protein
MLTMRTMRSTTDGRVVELRLRSQKLLRRAMVESKDKAKIDPTTTDCSSIPKLAQAIGKSNATVGYLLATGVSARKSCSADTAQAIAKVLGWDVDELFEVRTSTLRRGNADGLSVSA